MLGERLCSQSDIDIMSWGYDGIQTAHSKVSNVHAESECPRSNVQCPMSETRNTNLVCHIRGACIAYMDLDIRRHESVHPEEGERNRSQGREEG